MEQIQVSIAHHRLYFSSLSKPYIITHWSSEAPSVISWLITLFSQSNSHMAVQILCLKHKSLATIIQGTVSQYIQTPPPNLLAIYLYTSISLHYASLLSSLCVSHTPNSLPSPLQMFFLRSQVAASFALSGLSLHVMSSRRPFLINQMKGFSSPTSSILCIIFF